jgi:hypothetical protein
MHNLKFMEYHNPGFVYKKEVERFHLYIQKKKNVNFAFMMLIYIYFFKISK